MEEDYLKRVVSGTFFIFLFGILGAFLGYLLRFVLTSNLSPADYGLYYACLSLIGLFALFKDLGLTQSLIYHISKYRTEKKFENLKSSIFVVFLLQLFPATLITFIVFFSANFLAANYLHLSENISNGVLIIKILAIAYFIDVFYCTINSILQGFQKMKFFALTNFCRMIFYFSLSWLLISINFSALSPAFGFLFSYIFTIFIFSPLALKLIPKVNFGFNRRLAKKLFLYGLPIMLSGVAGIVIGNTDTILITFFRTLPEVGIYQTAQPTARLLWFFAGSFTTVLFPLITEMKAKNKRIERGIKLIYKYVWIIIIPFSLMAISFSREILNLFFGSFYAQGSLVLKMLSIGAIFFSVVQINGTILNGLGKPRNYTKIIYIGAIINLIGNFILIPSIGISGAAISTLSTYIIMFFFSFRELRKFVKVVVPIFDWIKTLIIGIFSLLTIYLLKSFLVCNLYLEVFLCFSVSVLLFFSFLILFGVLKPKEIKTLFKQILK